MYRTDCAAQPTFRGQSGDPTRPGLQHLNAAQLRLRTGDQLTETIDDYIDVFQELQIDPVYHNTFWHDVIYRYRQAPRHATFLKRGTAASIKNMSNDILRAYGLRIWGPKSGWRSGLAQGEKPLVYERAGDNSRLYEILAKLWWRMRELIYEEKPAPQSRGPSRKTSLSKVTFPGDGLSDSDDTYLADIDDGTDSEGGTALAPSKIARAKVLAKLNRIEEQLPAAAAGKFLTFQQTENEIINIVGRLHDLRLASNPDIFERLWAAHIGRVEEVEASIREGDIIPIGEDMDEEGKPLDVNTPEIEERGSDEDAVMKDNFELFPGTSIPAAPKRGKVAATISNAAAVPFPTQLVSDAAIRQRSYPNYSSEPFNSAGNPKALSLTQQHYLRPQLPGVMSIWIMTSPPHVSYRNRAYHHPAAPVQEQEMVAFFTQVMERAEHVREKDVKGYALGYGWCDVSRWIEKTVGQGCRGLGDGVKAGESEGERLGWEVFQKDLLDAVTKGVMVWRMKVLVVKK